MKSATAMLLKKTDRKIWHRGEVYADQGRVRTVHRDDKVMVAEVQGTLPYIVKLEFAPNGISQECNCPYFTENGCICKHIVAVGIVWDEDRGISRPGPALVLQGTPAPPRLSRRDIYRLFDYPLKADLDHLRIFPEETALSGRGRPHSKLPRIPKIVTDANQPLNPKELRQCYSEMKRWSRRKAYDPYFCAGEMVAAFCELLGIVKARMAVTESLVAAEILLSAQKFHCQLIVELIDSSQGLYEISEAYLYDVYCHLQEMPVSDQDRTVLDPLLADFDQRRGVYEE